MQSSNNSSRQFSKSAVGVASAALVLCVAATSAKAVNNLLVNSGFESPTTSAQVDAVAAGWTFDGPDIARANYANHTPSGARSIWLKTFLPGGGDVTQSATVVGGSPYTMSTYLYYESAYPTTAAVIDLSVSWFDTGGAPIGTALTKQILPGSITAGMTNMWNLTTLSGSSPAGAATAKVLVGWEDGGTVDGAQSVFADDVVLDGAGTPPNNSAWINTGSGDWNVVGNWANGTVPNAVGATAEFLSAITAPHTVYSDTAITAGTLRFNNANTYVISGAGSLTMDVASGNALFDVLAGAHKINLPLRLNKSTTASVASGATLTIADPLTLANGATLNKTGAGTLEIVSTVTSVSAATIMTSGGNTNLRLDAGINTSLRAAGGTTTLFATQHVAGVTIDSGGTLAIDSTGPAKVLKTTGLTFSAGSPQGKLDLGDNGLIVTYTGTSPAEAIRTAIITGYNGGPFNGNGISTTAAAGGRGIGYADSTQINSPTTFLGESFTGNAVLVRYTLLGDSNLDGKVNFDDLLTLAQNYNKLTGERWFNGDSNYDAKVNFDDLLALAQNYNANLPADVAALSAAGGNGFAADWALAQSLVPEPTSLSVMGLVVAGIAGRRRTR